MQGELMMIMITDSVEEVMLVTKLLRANYKLIIVSLYFLPLTLTHRYSIGRIGRDYQTGGGRM